MKLRHIEVFHAVYVCGSVSAAARLLNVSQPSITRTLQHAEQLLGFPLFVRTKGRLLPTEDAHHLFAEVSTIQERVYGLRQISQNMRQGRGGTVRIAALPSLGLSAIPGAVARFLCAHPGVSFDLQTAHHDEVMRRLYEREADLFVGFEAPRGEPLAHHRIGSGELVAMFRRADLPDVGPRLPLAALAGHAFVSPVQSGPIGQLLTRELSRVGVLLDEVVRARTFYVATALVRAGVGLTVVDNFTAQATVTAELTFRPLDPPLAFEVYAVYLASRPPAVLATAFLRDLAIELGHNFSLYPPVEPI
jgi:DNA-binding transcriptional LysR family regulator